MIVSKIVGKAKNKNKKRTTKNCNLKKNYYLCKKFDMASIKGLKKNVTYAFSRLLDMIYMFEATSEKGKTEQTQAIVDEIMQEYDRIFEKINDKSVQNRASHLKGVRGEFYESSRKIVEKINSLG